MRFERKSLAAALLFAVGACFVIWRCRYGFANIDEAFYLTVPYRLVRGDALIAEEWHVSQTSSVFLVLPMLLQLKIFGGLDGVMLHFRYLYAFVWICSALCLFLRLRRYSYGGALLGSLLFLLYAPWGIMALSYNSLGLLFILACCLIWLDADSLRLNTRRAFASGVCFGCAVLCCPHLFLAWVIASIGLGARWMVRRRDTDNMLMRNYLISSVVSLIVGLVFLGFVFSRATLGEVMNAVPHILEDPRHQARGPIELVSSLIEPIRKGSPLFVLWATLTIVLGIWSRSRPQHVRLACGLACGVTVCLSILTYKNIEISYTMLLTSMFGVYAYLARDGLRVDGDGDGPDAVPDGSVGIGASDDDVRRIFFGMWVPGIVYGVCIHMGSNQHLICFSHAMTVSAIASLLMMAIRVREAKAVPGRAAMIARVGMMLCLVLPIAHLGWMRYRTAYWDAPIEQMEATATFGPERGITMSKRMYDVYVKDWNAVRSIRTRQLGGPVLCLSCDTWLYLLLEEEFGTFSAWLGDVDQLDINRLHTYWKLNESKRPVMAICDDSTLIDSLSDALGLRARMYWMLDSGRWVLLF